MLLLLHKSKTDTSQKGESAERKKREKEREIMYIPCEEN